MKKEIIPIILGSITLIIGAIIILFFLKDFHEKLIFLIGFIIGDLWMFFVSLQMLIQLKENKK